MSDTKNFDQPLTEGEESSDKLAQKWRLAKKLAADMEIQRMFSLTEPQITDNLATVEISDQGFDLSPAFQSPGWKEALDHPKIKESDLGGIGDPQLAHEMKHGLHYFLCCDLFKTPDALANFDLFKTNVLTDPDFVENIKKTGSPAQKQFLETAQEFAKQPQSQVEIKKMSYLFGALTYQHAYFLDPAMCEAVASFKDSDPLLATLHSANRTIGETLIPGDDPMEGYGNINYQHRFMSAKLDHKALLTLKSNYNRTTFFP